MSVTPTSSAIAPSSEPSRSASPSLAAMTSCVRAMSLTEVKAAGGGAAAASTSATAPAPAANAEAMDSVEVLYNACYGGIVYSDELLERMSDMLHDTKGLSSREAESLLRSRHPAIGSDTQWKMHTEHRQFITDRCYREKARMHPFLLHLVREMNGAANGLFTRLAIARISFPTALPLGSLAQGLRISEYDGLEGVWFHPELAFQHFFRTAYIECEDTSTLSLHELAKIYRQCEQVSVEDDLITPKAEESDESE